MTNVSHIFSEIAPFFLSFTIPKMIRGPTFLIVHVLFLLVCFFLLLKVKHFKSVS